MIKFKKGKNEFEISDDFDIKAPNSKSKKAIELYLKLVFKEFGSPGDGDPFLILERELKKDGFEILEVKDIFNPDVIY